MNSELGNHVALSTRIDESSRSHAWAYFVEMLHLMIASARVAHSMGGYML